MKDIKKNYTRSLALGALILSGSLLQACGGDPDYDQRYQNDYYQNSAGCQVPAGIKERTVVGSFGDGSTLRIDIFSQSGNTVAAYSELSVPSVEALFGVNVFNGNVNNNQMITGYTGANSQFRTCVSSNGFTGTMLRDSTYQEVNMALVGNGNTYISMGSSIGVPAFISGDYLQGTVKMRVGSYPDSEFILAH